MSGHDIVVIGSSAGGVAAMQQLVRDLPPDLPAAVFVVVHISPHVPSMLAEILAKAGRMPALAVTRPLRFRPGTIYVAPPDHHLILSRTHVSIAHGPRENRHRPSVDVLFRSAAQELGPRVVGLVLTGFLDDGAAGLAAIHREGGVTMVQDPRDAVFPDMPRNALQAVPVDHVVPMAGMADALIRVVSRPHGRRRRAVAKEIATENQMSLMESNGRPRMEKIGTPSTFTCPECQGPLWELRNGDLLRYRCQVGHAFSADSMLKGQEEVVERALWVALGALQSRVALWRRIAERMKRSNLRTMAGYYRDRETQARGDMEELRRILTRKGGAGPAARAPTAPDTVSSARRPSARRRRARRSGGA